MTLPYVSLRFTFGVSALYILFYITILPKKLQSWDPVDHSFMILIIITMRSFSKLGAHSPLQRTKHSQNKLEQESVHANAATHTVSRIAWRGAISKMIWKMWVCLMTYLKLSSKQSLTIPQWRSVCSRLQKINKTLLQLLCTISSDSSNKINPIPRKWRVNPYLLLLTGMTICSG